MSRGAERSGSYWRLMCRNADADEEEESYGGAVAAVAHVAGGSRYFTPTLAVACHNGNPYQEHF